MMKRHSIHSALPRRHRRAAVTLEVILCVPVLVIAFVGVIEYGIVMAVHQTVTSAAIEGARESAKGGSHADVLTAVNGVMGVHGITLGNDDIRLEQGGAVVMPGSCTVPNGTPVTVVPAGETRVSLCVDIPSGPIGDFLSSFGFTLMGKEFKVSAFAVSE